MRLSTEKGDPGYQPTEVTVKYKVLINGAETDLVVTADDDTGYVKLLVDEPLDGGTREFFATKVEFVPTP